MMNTNTAAEIAERLRSLNDYIGNSGLANKAADMLVKYGRLAAGWEEEARSIQSNLDRYKEICDVHRRENAGETWFWQGDGFDFPESIACPVIMQAGKLRAMLDEIASLRQQLADAQSQLHACPTCGANCKDCECVEKKLATVPAERDELRRELDLLVEPTFSDELCRYMDIINNTGVDSEQAKQFEVEQLQGAKELFATARLLKKALSGQPREVAAKHIAKHFADNPLAISEIERRLREERPVDWPMDQPTPSTDVREASQ